jgi:hypothetical protein
MTEHLACQTPRQFYHAIFNQGDGVVFFFSKKKECDFFLVLRKFRVRSVSIAFGEPAKKTPWISVGKNK